MMKISEFQTKDVVNVMDGTRLGQVTDLEINLKLGRIDAIVVPGRGRLFGFFKGGEDLVIPWRNIIKIGKDVVLVRLQESLPYAEQKAQEEEEGYQPY
jgi:YlmC/YmxH family sporulation protein